MNQPPICCHSISPYTYEQPLLPTVPTNGLTQFPPAKKITFYKTGDPQFGGIKMAINQRSFKSLSALMDELSHRVPLSFGVRLITTPRGIHYISSLDQLEDGGCYLCSDKNYVTPINIGAASRKLGPQKTRRPANAFRRAAQDIKGVDYSMAFAQQNLKVPKKITLIKNGDIATQCPITLDYRNAQSFNVLLDEISEIMQFTVKKLYTMDGKRIDSVDGLLLCPNVLICVGREPFKPVRMQNVKNRFSEKRPGLASHSNNTGRSNEMETTMNLRLKSKKSVIHPRSSLSNQSMRFLASSQKSYKNGPATSVENGILSLDNGLHSKEEDLGHSSVSDDIEKKVYVNKDGSLSVELKIHFHLLTDKTLQWSTQIKKSNLMNKISCEESGVSKGKGIEQTEKINQDLSSEMDDTLYPCDADSCISNLDESENEETYCQSYGKPQRNYWKNPMHVSQKEEPWVENTWYTHSSCSTTSSQQRIVHTKKASIDSVHTSPNKDTYSENHVQEISHHSGTAENKVEKCCCQHDDMQIETSQNGFLEKIDVPSLTGSQKEKCCIMGKKRDKSKGSRGRNNKSPFQCSAERRLNMLEKTSSVIRTVSSCSIKEREEVVDCSSSSNVACSEFSKCSMHEARDNLDKISENDRITSFPSNICFRTKFTQEEAVNKDEKMRETYFVTKKMGSNQPIRDDGSNDKTFQSEVGRERSRSGSNKMHKPSADMSASRMFKRSKHGQIYAEPDCKLSGGSARASTIKKNKTKSPLHDEDGRSGRSYYSKNSHRIVERDKGVTSNYSSSPDSKVSLLSKASPCSSSNANTSRMSNYHKESSQRSWKGNQFVDMDKPLSPGSNFFEAYGGNDSISKSGFFTCGHIVETRNNDLQCATSRILSYCDANSRCSEMQVSGGNDNVCLQSSIAQTSKPRQKGKNSIPGSKNDCSHVSNKVSAALRRFQCPAPPKRRPTSRKSQTVLLNSSSAIGCTEREPTADERQKGTAVFQLPETDPSNETGNNWVIWKEKEGSCREQEQFEAEAKAEMASENDGQIFPSSLPNATPGEVVRDWLGKIPSETLPMKCKIQTDGEGTEVHTEIPSCSNNQETWQEERCEQEGTEDGENTAAAGEEEAKGGSKEENAFEMIAEDAGADQADRNHSVGHSPNDLRNDLPNTIEISVNIMKALLASKHESKLDRSQSLPEVSPTIGRKLSHSANTLIGCLASLQLRHEELDPSNKLDTCLNLPRYQEFLNIFQAVWFGSTSEKGGLRPDLQQEALKKADSGFKGPNSKYGAFTPVTSSGVDVSSGDEVSGEGNAGADCAFLLEKRDGIKFPEEDAKPEGKAGNAEERKEHSVPPTPCSKLESRKLPELIGLEIKVDQDSKEKEKVIPGEELKENCRHDDQKVKDTDNDPDDHSVQVKNQTDTIVKAEGKNPSQVCAEEPRNHETESDLSENEPPGEKEAKVNVEKRSEDTADSEFRNKITHQTAVKVSPETQQRSISPDSVWMIKLLKKIEKEFLTHYTSAMNEFKVKYNLSNSEEHDLIIAELIEEVGRKTQNSVERELRKIKSRAGKKIPRPLDDELRYESTLRRRRRLTNIHQITLRDIIDQSSNLSTPLESGDLSYDLKKDLLYSTVQNDDRYDAQLRDEEYCPCKTCIMTKMVAKPAQDAVVGMGRVPIPVMKAFDLQEILRMKKINVAHRKAEHDLTKQGLDEAVECEEEQEAKSDERKEADGTRKQEASEDKVLADNDGVSENQNHKEEEEEKKEAAAKEEMLVEKEKWAEEEEIKGQGCKVTGGRGGRGGDRKSVKKEEGAEEDSPKVENKKEEYVKEEVKKEQKNEVKEQGEEEVINEDYQELKEKPDGEKEGNGEEEGVGGQGEAHHEPSTEDKTDRTAERGQRKSNRKAFIENVNGVQAIFEAEVYAGANSKAECEGCLGRAKAGKEDQNKMGGKIRRNKAERENGSESVLNDGDKEGNRTIKRNGALKGPAIRGKRTMGDFPPLSQKRTNGGREEPEEEENIDKEDGEGRCDGESKSDAESTFAKMYPDSEEEQSTQASVEIGENLPEEEDEDDNHPDSKKKEEASAAINQEDLDF